MRHTHTKCHFLAYQLAPPATQPSSAHALGCFKLTCGSAMTLTFKAAGELRVAHGSAWVTLASAALDTSAWAGDHFLQLEQTLAIKAGQAVVLEALDGNLYFDLVVDAKALVTLSSPASSLRPVLAWALGVVSQALDRLALRLFGLAQSARAFGQTGLHPSGAATLGCQS